jgi:purine-binding chemotaxis protein CheW
MRIDAADHILVFSVEGMRHALPLPGVEKVELAAEVTPFPEAPAVVIGAMTWRGQILPVLSLRRRLHAAERTVMTSDRFVIVRTSRRRLALMVDEVHGVQQAAARDMARAETLSQGLGSVAGAVRTADGIVLIHDLDLFLSEEEERVLQKL